MKFFDFILDALYPPDFTCELCGKEIFDGGRLCAKCVPKLPLNNGITCPLCGRKAEFCDQLCLDCKADAPAYDKGVSALVYEEGAQKLILAFKKDKPYLKDYFADLMYDKCKELEGVDGVVSVPMTGRSLRRRGYDQAMILAQALAKRLNLPYLKDAIAKVKNTPEQKSLTKRERVENLKGCFKAQRSVVEDKVLLVVDDVLTTGATADAVCKELKKRKAAKIYFATVASVAYKGEI